MPRSRMFRLALYGMILLSLLLLAGCSGKNTAPKDPAFVQSESVQNEGSLSSKQSNADAAFEDYDEAPGEQIADPLEGWNRFWFSFNDIVLTDIMKPVYTGYTYITPEPVRTGLSNFFYNLQMPIRFVNCLLQGRFAEAMVEFDRFLINSTVGFGGLFDVAKQSRPLVPVDSRPADFGQTLAVWGVGEGVYLVWPFFGPSTARDTIGLVGDAAASPFFWGAQPLGPVDPAVSLGANLALRFNDLGATIRTYEALTKSAVEPYVAARDAYLKYRRMIYSTLPVPR